MPGYGSGLYGSGLYGISDPVTIFPPATGLYTVIGGFDQTLNINYDGIKFSSYVGDQQPKATIDIYDVGSVSNFKIGDEVIIFNASDAYIPAHNLITSILWNSGWAAVNALAGSFTITNSNQNLNLPFSNSTGQGLYTQECPTGYAHAGQSYMLSVYANIASPLTNAQAQVYLQFLDFYGTSLSTISSVFASTTGNARQRISISGVAPAGTIFIQALVGGATTVDGNNSGTVTFDTPQIEPMWFAKAPGFFAYPTPNCNNTQINCAVMPDNTVSRACRIFAGAIKTWKIVAYDGPNRIIGLGIDGPGEILEDGNINQVYTGQYDDQIISSVVSTYFPGKINASTAPNTASPLPVIRGALIDAVSYNDNSLRELLNGLSDESGYMAYLDFYYCLRYNPAFYSAVSFALTDQTPDNITTFSYYEYYPELDGTQRAKDIKVTGGKFLAPAITDTFSANGSTSTFTLSQQPYKIDSVISNGNGQKAFFKGTGPTLGVNGYSCEVNKTAMTIHFNFNPAAGTNNVTCTYSYEAPVSVRAISQDTTNLPTAPAYAIPAYSAKVNDTNLLTIASAIQRGLAEISKWSKPLDIKILKCSQYIPPGYIVPFTDTIGGIVNQPYVCQQVDLTYLGNGLAEFSYTLGAYRPTLLDHIRNANKAVNRSTTTSNVNTPQQTDLVFSDTAQYSDSLSFTLTPPNPGNYDASTSIYGTTTYS